jgi:hypothetical protein
VPIAPEEYLLEMGLRMGNGQSEEHGEVAGILVVSGASARYGCPGAAPGTD